MDEARAAVIEQPAFKAAHAPGTDWGLTAKACLDGLGELPVGANLGFLYATDALAGDLGSILTFLRECSGIEHWIGTTGFGIAASGIEYHDRPALAVMVAALPDDSFRMLSPLTGAGDEIDASTRAWMEANAPVLGVVHGDPRNRELPDIVRRLAAQGPAFLVGGLSASRGETLQIADRPGAGGLSGVLLSSNLPVATGLTQGCAPIGPVRRITAAEQNVIEEIDERPALEVFKEDIGELLARDLRRIGGYIFAGFPIAGSDTGDYLVRNVVSIDPERQWLAVGEAVEPGRGILFCRRDHDAATADMQRMLAGLKKRGGDKARAGLYISCLARGHNLFGSESEELKLIRQALGDIPLVGFFANGEISNDRLYSYTGVLTLFL